MKKEEDEKRSRGERNSEWVEKIMKEKEKKKKKIESGRREIE